MQRSGLLLKPQVYLGKDITQRKFPGQISETSALIPSATVVSNVLLTSRSRLDLLVGMTHLPIPRRCKSSSTEGENLSTMGSGDVSSCEKYHNWLFVVCVKRRGTSRVWRDHHSPWTCLGSSLHLSRLVKIWRSLQRPSLRWPQRL